MHRSLLHRRSNRLCGAKLGPKQAAMRGHPYCRAIVPAGLKRCPWHGGKSTGPRTAEGKARCLAAANAGAATWRERMRAAIEAGFIDRWPGRPKGSKNRPKPGQTTAATPPPKKEQMMPRKAAPAPVRAVAPTPVPIADDIASRREMVEWQAKTRAEKLDKLTDEALDIVQWVFRLDPNADANPRVLSAKKDAALSVLALEFKVGESVAERERKERDRALILADIARKLDTADRL